MKLSRLIEHDFDNDPEITGITSDSRKVKDGYIFAALRGVQADGNEFIGQAIENGAVVVLTEHDHKKWQKKAILLKRGNVRRIYGQLAAKIYGDQPDCVYAVTGTSGKSSVVWMGREILKALGYSSASIGTMGVYAGDYHEEGHLTSFDPVDLHTAISTIREKENVTDLFIEASSHGIDQERLAGLRIDIAAFTNLSHEHLDYHGTLDEYFQAKAKLFTRDLKESGAAVLNADIAEYERLKDLCYHKNIKVISYGTRGSDITLITSKSVYNGTEAVIALGQNSHAFHLPLVGAFQLANVMCAIGLVLAAHPDIDHEKLFKVISGLKPVPGRLEPVKAHIKNASVYIDYAHKPGALEAVINAVRKHTAGELTVVFGCGGDRDREKRPQMGALAQRLADHVIITDDNPRTEDPSKIRSEILAACPKAKEIGDRRHAIADALSHLKSGDSLIIAGKGHETGQTQAGKTTPFDDRVVTREEILVLEKKK